MATPDNHLPRIPISLPNFEAPPIDQQAPAAPPVMLVFRFKDGRAVAFAYAHLYQIEIDRTPSIILHFSAHAVKLEGTNLISGIYHRLARQDIAEVVEEDDLQTQVLSQSPYLITRITITTL